MADRANLSGLWLGSYSYPEGKGPTTPFMAKIVDRGGSLTGETVEPNMMGLASESLAAFIAGTRDGDAVDFTKTYDGASDAAHAVDYVGRLSADGNSVTGVWSLEDLDGSFEMHREAVWEERAGKEADVAKLALADDPGESARELEGAVDPRRGIGPGAGDDELRVRP